MNDKNKEPLFHIVKRGAIPWYQSLAIYAAAIVLALVLCAVVTTVTTGINPLNVFESIFTGAFGSTRKTWVTLQNISILLLISLALTPAFKMNRSLCLTSFLTPHNPKVAASIVTRLP